MFCGECGAKNKKGDVFCSECGAPLKQEEVRTVVKNTTTSRQPMSKKRKLIIAVVIAVILVLGVGYKVGSDMSSPKNIAKKYIQAVMDNNANALYGYLELDGDKTFISKKIYKDLFKEKKSNEVTNFKITDVKYGDSKLNATVNFTYTTKNSSNENNSSIILTKQKGKKFILFDNWKIGTDYKSINVVEDYTIKVASGTKVTYAGVELTKKYKSEDKSTSTLDAYVLPQVFSAKTTIKATYKNGMEIEETFTPYSSNSTHTVNFNENNISDSMKSKLLTVAENSLKAVYENALADKPFADIKAKFEHGNIDLTKIESAYNTLVTDLKSATSTLKSISFTKFELSDLTLTTDGNLELDVKTTYDYTIDYKDWNDVTQTHSDSDYSYMTVIITNDKNAYYTVDLDDLEDYFSRY